MQVKDGLPGAFAGINHRAISIRQLEFARQFRRHQLQLAQHGLIFRCGLV